MACFAGFEETSLWDTRNHSAFIRKLQYKVSRIEDICVSVGVHNAPLYLNNTLIINKYPINTIPCHPRNLVHTLNLPLLKDTS